MGGRLDERCQAALRCTAPKGIAGAEICDRISVTEAIFASRQLSQHEFSGVNWERARGSRDQDNARPAGVEPAPARRFFVTEVSMRPRGPARAPGGGARGRGTRP
jgi:hypothetical protein